jgi:hypothetical protein
MSSAFGFRIIATALLLGTLPLGAQQGPRTIVMRGELLQQAHTRLRAGDATLRPAYEKLMDDARKALAQPLVAVTQKSGPLPPSGDKHDYFSLSPYWWPDPAKADGLPYIRRDGVTNPESKRDLDQPRVARLGANVQTLALAYFFSGEERFSARTAEQLRTWFLDSATRMNPHLRFAQLVRGNPRERGSGIIDTRWFIEVVDAAKIIEGSPSWSTKDRDALRAWMAEYLRWLRTSPNGQHEHAAKNNHGSWFAAQTAALALYAGDTAAAREIISAIPARVAAQITSTGDQPIENERTRSFHYAGFNIEALSRLAEMGRHVGIDLWSYQAPQGGSLRRAVDHVAKHLANPSTWPGRQIDPIEMELFVIHLRRTDHAIRGADYSAILRQLPAKLVREDRSALLYPDR